MPTIRLSALMHKGDNFPVCICFIIFVHWVTVDTVSTDRLLQRTNVCCEVINCKLYGSTQKLIWCD
jgi:hypothetical protein